MSSFLYSLGLNPNLGFIQSITNIIPANANKDTNKNYNKDKNLKENLITPQKTKSNNKQIINKMNDNNNNRYDHYYINDDK